MKTEELMDTMADNFEQMRASVEENVLYECVYPKTDELDDLWKKLNKEYKDPEKLGKSDFCIKKGMGLHITGSFRKAFNIMNRSWKEQQIAALTSKKGLGSPEHSFLRNNYKEALKRMER